MEIIKTLLWIVQIVSAVSIIILVLLQHGKGADAGATFGSSGGSASLFGASGSSNFLSRATALCATVFFLVTLGLVFISNKSSDGVGVMSGVITKSSANAVTSMPATSNTADVSKANGSSVKLESALPKQNQIPH